ncbi:MAG: (deoxy)nucleoside triphosphate pyrophosphohydrolase [Clostridium sp.]|nr:(deoxy)nucleoside triphosphate pyrophosphohydrolase [Clostridium sp.]
MKNIHVSAAIIMKDNKIFVTQRGYGEFKDWWEFPGGKIEEGETPEECLKREIKEELEADINIDKYLCTVEYDYPNFHLKMECFICSLIDGHLELVEAEDAKFITNDQLDNIDFLPADLLVVKELKKSI